MTLNGHSGTAGMDSNTLCCTTSFSAVRLEPFAGEAGAGCASITAARGCKWGPRLRDALREGRFLLHYQPIACLQSGEISHYEALIRLVGEDGTLLTPNLFLPAAERLGMIVEIDRFVVQQVAELLGAGATEIGEGVMAVDCEASDMSCGPLRVAINLSAQSASDPEMLAYIKRQLALSLVDPARLVVEITETAAISDMEQAKALCRGLQKLGCAVALDDFGAGFGSFHYVKHLPFDYLKIDGDFVRELAGSPDDQLLVGALVQVARGMNMQTIAEFVEDQATMEMLRSLGVDYAQGYEVGRPGPLPSSASSLERELSMQMVV
jgi:EAL domain-containing protein (putative c-di-GMP-specific phosphodiesterase class I)